MCAWRCKLKLNTNIRFISERARLHLTSSGRPTLLVYHFTGWLTNWPFNSICKLMRWSSRPNARTCFLVLIAGIRRHQIVMFTVYHGRQGSKAALIIMCMWAALKFKLFCIVHTASRCLSSGLFICLRRFLILLVCKNFTASHESCGLCMTTPQGSLCDPVWGFTDPLGG